MRINPRVAAVVEPPVALAKALVSGRAFPPDRALLDLSQAVPSYPPADDLLDNLAGVLRRPETSAYAPTLGLPQAREALAAHLTAAYGGPVAAEQVLITAGCNEAFCLAVDVLAGPGDEVVLPVPFYFNHDMWLRARGVRPAYLPLDPGCGMVPDPQRVAALVGERTRAVVLVTPNNPAGVEYPPAVVGQVFEICRARGVALVIDETYKDFRATDGPPHDLFARDGWDDTVIQLFSFSKVFSLAGYRCGSLVSGVGVVREAAKLADCLTIGAPRIAQEAAMYGLGHLDGWVAGKRREMLQRVETFRSALAGEAGARGGYDNYELVSSGAYFAYLRHPFDGVAGSEVARRLVAEQNLLCIPGECFGPGQEPFLRLAFGNVEADLIPEVVTRLTAGTP